MSVVVLRVPIPCVGKYFGIREEKFMQLVRYTSPDLCLNNIILDMDGYGRIRNWISLIRTT
jgi:hypothetical protein